MTFSEATEYLYTSAPLFQNIGAGAYKEGLSTTKALDAHFGHPHQSYQTIHVAGTNGKGSVSHTLAACLQAVGYRVGLFTSPHLVDFRERIRINGQMIPQQRVIQFIETEREFFEPLHPSFFELTTALAFLYFQEEKVDVAVIEVGLGGRLDCTNIIRPDLSIITNISFDHIQFLGDTLPKIAAEKAGIIKPDIPVVIGETGGNPEVRQVFLEKAKTQHSPIIFADESDAVLSANCHDTGGYSYSTSLLGNLEGELGGYCQEKNTSTILVALSELRKSGYSLSDEAIRIGFSSVSRLTGLMGRWQTIRNKPRVICDTGHNVGGIQYIVRQLAATPHQVLHIIIGMVSDKDIHTVLTLLPREAKYYFTQASVKRSIPVDELSTMAKNEGLKGTSYPNVEKAYAEALEKAQEDDIIFVGGSSFVVSDLLTCIL